MLGVVGTVPDPDFPASLGEAHLEGERIFISGRGVEINRGTPALLAAALKTSQSLGSGGVVSFMVGDTGLGRGSRELYRRLTEELPGQELKVLAFHYLQPDVDWHNRVLFAIQEMNPRPLLVADAGFMYAAKMSGQAPNYDLFTPDSGELAFLADEDAPHPFYTRGFILQEGNDIPELIRRAYSHRNAARHLLIKGAHDYLAAGPDRISRLNGPSHPALEAIGGTGDTLTGIAAALLEAGWSVIQAATTAALTNRLAGQLAQPDPATRIEEIIRRIPEALGLALEKTAGA